MIHATMGALQRPITPYRSTLRPLAVASVAPEHSPTYRQGTMLPPPSLPDWEVEVEITWDESLSVETAIYTTPATLRAIILASQVNECQDQPYKPEADTTYQEAVTHLHREHYILIHGGRIVHQVGSYSLRLLAEEDVHVIPWKEVEELLEFSYPGAPQPTTVHDTDPCPAPKPEPREGVGLYCFAPYGGDLDEIPYDMWHGIAFPRGVNHQTLYVGDLMLDDMGTWDVWWSVPLACYLAQLIPHQELLERFPHLNTQETHT